MAIAQCKAVPDAQGRELTAHGTKAFPVACYCDNLTQEPVPPHWHEELEVAVILSGEAAVAIGGETYRVPAGDGFFVNTNVLHAVDAVGASLCLLHSLVFHPQLLGEAGSFYQRQYLHPLLSGGKTGLILCRESPRQNAALSHLESAWQACAEEPPDFALLARSDLSRLIGVLARELPPSDAPAVPARDSIRIKQMLQFLEAHSSGPMTLGEIAKSAAVSESECLRCFHKTVGISPISYLTQYRLRQAAAMLRAADHPIGEIAIQCGFQDVSYFSKQFRNRYHCTPSQYRKSHQG